MPVIIDLFGRDGEKNIIVNSSAIPTRRRRRSDWASRETDFMACGLAFLPPSHSVQRFLTGFQLFSALFCTFFLSLSLFFFYAKTGLKFWTVNCHARSVLRQFGNAFLMGAKVAVVAPPWMRVTLFEVVDLRGGHARGSLFKLLQVLIFGKFKVVKRACRFLFFAK